ncbi:putative aldehyde dehydrogenase [Mytilinidion resinicola]|uniref:aldehyde dehydrogenase (NAD(+)) n=1 Tax=Mytilinidion resinicola TaxID=574789 RepID=A0A6A6YR79_9PEZI|nr:putative aldehyde dehydrogenase [Mytilinidion resinicola]KAF2811426.1 putative aldehyde dehydrogenase [Mytilinidion resinicola]
MAVNGTRDHLHKGLFINNEYVDAKNKETLTVSNPVDGSLVAEGIQVAGEADIDAAVEAAEAAYRGPWSTWTAKERSKVMLKMADLIEANAKDLAPLETIAMGQPAWLSEFLIGAAVDAWRYYAGWTDKLSGEQFPADDGNYKIVQYEPLGVCAMIGAWNGSMMFHAMKTSAAVASGNTCIYKGSEKSPLGVLAMGALAKEAGFPPGVINIVTGAGATGAMLASHMKIRKISFTGSVFAGKKVQELAAKSNLKRVTLELGGKSPSIIFEDADMENVLTHHSQNFLMNSTQICVAASRTFVHESIAEKFVEGLKARFEALGDQPGFMGPLVDKAQFDRVTGYLEVGKKEAELITGGSQKGKNGFFIQPTIFLNPAEDARIYREEIFGPVITIKTFKTEEEVVRMANDTEYGLAAYIFTSVLSRALRIAGKLESGLVNINTSTAFAMSVPFGGSKQSGVGRESGKAGLLAFMEPKTILINMNI